MFRSKISRRRALAGLGACGAAALGAGLGMPRRSQAGSGDGPRFLIVLSASGGGSLIDAMLAIRESECATPDTINCYPDSLVQDISGSPFRALDQSFTKLGPIPMPFSANQSSFVNKHHQEMMIATITGTSVNHAVAQRRSVTGNEAWHGRTLQEAVALQHGDGFPLPNVHLLAGTGFSERGADDSLPSQCFGETVADPTLWPLALDGLLGTAHPVDRDLFAAARTLRNETLDPQSKFVQAFGSSHRLEEWAHLRGLPQQSIEAADLIDKLIFLPDGDQYPLSAHGLQSSPDADLVRSAFPNYATDSLHAQAALAFLLLRNQVSVSVTLGPSFSAEIQGSISGGQLPEGAMANPPIAFDFSHQAARASQAFMWDRVLKVADGLITLLQGEPFGTNGESMWDRTVLYFATDFGRAKNRPSGATEFGAGHDLNNGMLLVSPLVKGNTVLGGVDPNTGLTYGFDPNTGAADTGRTMTEPEIYSGILGALGVDTGGELPDVPAMRKS